MAAQSKTQASHLCYSKRYGRRRRQPPEHRAALRARRLLRASGIVVISLFIAAVTLDHLGCFGYRGNDHANFDGKPFLIDHVSEDGSLVLRDKPMTAVTLLGVSMPGKKHAVNEARGYLERAGRGETGDSQTRSPGDSRRGGPFVGVCVSYRQRRFECRHREGWTRLRGHAAENFAAGEHRERGDSMRESTIAGYGRRCEIRERPPIHNRRCLVMTQSTATCGT